MEGTNLVGLAGLLADADAAGHQRASRLPAGLKCVGGCFLLSHLSLPSLHPFRTNWSY